MTEPKLPLTSTTMIVGAHRLGELRWSRRDPRRLRSWTNDTSTSVAGRTDWPRLRPPRFWSPPPLS
jgi:hypothetical protein